MPYKDPIARLKWRQRYYKANKARIIRDVCARRKAKGPGSRKGEGRNYYLKHKARLIAQTTAWAKAHRESRLATYRKYNRKNKVKRSLYKKLYNQHNREAVVAYRQKIKPKMRIYQTQWRKRNPDKVKAIKQRHILTGKMADTNQRRRARKRLAPYESCSSKITLLRAKHFCHWCCVRFVENSPYRLTIDHVIPLSRGGHHIPDNLVAACYTCNVSKNSKLVSEWLPNKLKEAA